MQKFTKIFSIIIPLTEILFYALFIIGLSINLSVLVLVAMVGIIICCAYTLISPLIISRKLFTYEIIEIAVAGTLTTTFAIIFICSIPEVYRGVVSTIAGSIMSGLFTLFGVGLTIKYNRLAKEEDDKKKAKPHIFPVSEETFFSVGGFQKRVITTDRWVSDLEQPKPKDKYFTIDRLFLANSDLAMCVYEGIIVNKHFLYFDNGTVLLRGLHAELFQDVSFTLDEKITNVSLILSDMYDNQYRADMEFKLVDHDSYTEIQIISVYRTVELEKEFQIPKGPISKE